MANVTIDELGPCKRRLNVEISPETINGVVEEIYKDLAKTAKIPGFRVGKVPRKVLVTRFNKDVLEEAKSRIITDSYRESIKEKNLNPVHVPKIENISFDPDTSLRYTAEFEIEPEFELKSYDGIKVKVSKISVSDDDIEDQLQHIRESQATLENVEDRPAVMGDFVLIDYILKTTDDETVIEEGSSKMLHMQEQSSFLKDVIAELEGMSVGDTKTVITLLPDEYAKPEFAGQEASITVTLVAIKEKMLPEVNDEFAQSVGNFKSVDEMHQELTKLIEAQKKSGQRKEGKGQIADYLLDKHHFSLPESVVESEFQSMLRSAMRSMPQEQPDIEKLKKKLREDAEKKVALSYILAEIASKENITVDQAEVNHAIEYTARSWNVSSDKLREHLTDTGGIYSMQEQILQDKVLDLLYDKARVIEK